MKCYLLLSILCFIHTRHFAQINISHPAGVYYLNNVREMVSVFEIKTDSSFTFFLSFGAMDRHGEGKWKVEASKIVLNTINKNQPNFTLVKEEKSERDNFVIKFVDINEFLYPYLSAIIFSNGNKLMEKANNQGEINFRSNKVDKVILFFDWCPDKQVTFVPSNPQQNYFSFSPSPTFWDVVFDNVIMEFNNNILAGRLPFWDEKELQFVKGN